VVKHFISKVGAVKTVPTVTHTSFNESFPDLGLISNAINNFFQLTMALFM